MNQLQLERIDHDLRQYVDCSTVEAAITLPQLLDLPTEVPASVKPDLKRVRDMADEIEQVINSWLQKYNDIAATIKAIFELQAKYDLAISKLTKPLDSYAFHRNRGYAHPIAQEAHTLKNSIDLRQGQLWRYRAINDNLDIEAMVADYHALYENMMVRIKVAKPAKPAKPRVTKAEAPHTRYVSSEFDENGVATLATSKMVSALRGVGDGLLRIIGQDTEFGLVPVKLLFGLVCALESGTMTLQKGGDGIQMTYQSGNVTGQAVLFTPTIPKKITYSLILGE